MGWQKHLPSPIGWQVQPGTMGQVSGSLPVTGQLQEPWEKVVHPAAAFLQVG
jgi:hypothetical protein